MPRYWSFPQNSRCACNEQPCLKTTGLYEDILPFSSLFYFSCFIFSAAILCSLCVLISPALTLLLLLFFLKTLSSIVEKLLYTHIQVVYIIYIYILENL